MPSFLRQTQLSKRGLLFTTNNKLLFIAKANISFHSVSAFTDT